MRRARFGCWLGLVGVLLLCACSGGGDGGVGGGEGAGGGGGGTVPDKPHPMGGSSWTVLVYMVADNDLERFALDDLDEMMQVGSTTGLNIVVQVDRAEGNSSGPAGNLGDFTSTKRVLVKQGELQELADLGEQNMADPATLAAFVTWGLQTYPADRTAVVFWDHGGGWTGFGVDEASGALLSLTQIEAGLKQGIAGANGKPLSLVGFDACLMATWEVALTMAPHAEYLLASEESEPGHGWDWRALSVLAQNPSTDSIAFGKKVIVDFKAQATAQQTVDGVTLSLIDLYRLGTLGKAIDGFTATFDKSAALATAFGRGQEGAQKYGDSPDPANAQNMVDLGHLATLTAGQATSVSAAAQTLSNALGEAVIDHFEGAGKINSKGMSIYFPPNSTYYKPGYDGLAAPDLWRTFLKSYFGGNTAVTGKPTFTNANKLAASAFQQGSLVAEGTLAADGLSSLARVTVLTGIVNGNFLVMTGESEAQVSGTTVQATWDLSVLTLTQGTNVGLGFATVSTLPGNKLELDILFAYRKTAAAAPQDCIRQLVFSADTAGTVTLSSDTYYVSTSGTVGELSPVAGSTLTPIVKTIDLTTGAESYEAGATTAFTTTNGTNGPQFDLALAYKAVQSGNKVAAILTATNAAGDGDAVAAVAVVP